MGGTPMLRKDGVVRSAGVPPVKESHGFMGKMPRLHKATNQGEYDNETYHQK
jgi:hypothetical protein